MSIKFIHYNNTIWNNSKVYDISLILQSKTIAYEQISKDQINWLINDFIKNGTTCIELNVGIALLHPKDRYNKKIGRETSISKMKIVNFKIKAINVNKDTLILFLEDYEHLNFNLVCNKKNLFARLNIGLKCY